MEPAFKDSRYILVEIDKCLISNEIKTNFVNDKAATIMSGTFQNQWVVAFQDVKNSVKKVIAKLMIIRLNVNKKICFFFRDEKLYKFH